ncbi:class I SAM-dependent methyltransferase [Zooshikella ganghwensis]|uniref:class I SAM-dependent methyltransferase n=1 Tax=Zooshikella ganghwensis TaxID=202772 RepID=UPI0004265CF2|nr:class I SAM-dependent methyltransferase [Zooshikella ganghwensis]
MLGKDIARNPNARFIEKVYINVFGVPISGLRIRLRRVLPYIFKGKSFSRILDAGCGRGVFCYEVAKKFPESMVVGCDIEIKKLVENAIIIDKCNIKNVSFVLADITRLPFNGYFDLAISVDNLEHLQDDMAGLSSIYSSLRSEGLLILHVPALERQWFIKFKENFNVPGHYRAGYTLDDIIKKVKLVGFNVNEAYYTFGYLETLANNISYLITKAEEKNKILYALLFPVINVVSWFGQWSKPKKGAGVLVVAKKGKMNEASV